MTYRRIIRVKTTHTRSNSLPSSIPCRRRLHWQHTTFSAFWQPTSPSSRRLLSVLCRSKSSWAYWCSVRKVWGGDGGRGGRAACRLGRAVAVVVDDWPLLVADGELVNDTMFASSPRLFGVVCSRSAAGSPLCISVLSAKNEGWR